MSALQLINDDPFDLYYFQHKPEIICGLPVKPITEEYCENYVPLIDRFFTRYFYLKPSGGTSLPYKVLFHTNRICLICLAPEHPAIQSKELQINFDVGNADRSKNTVSGKGKKGGMPLQADSTLCLITTAEGVIYKVPSCIKGKLVEVNMDLSEHPEKLINSKEGDNYIAIVLPKPEHCEELKSNLLSEEQYLSHVAQNSSKILENNDNVILYTDT